MIRSHLLNFILHDIIKSRMSGIKMSLVTWIFGTSEILSRHGAFCETYNESKDFGSAKASGPKTLSSFNTQIQTLKYVIHIERDVLKSNIYCISFSKWTPSHLYFQDSLTLRVEMIWEVILGWRLTYFLCCVSPAFLLYVRIP